MESDWVWFRDLWRWVECGRGAGVQDSFVVLLRWFSQSVALHLSIRLDDLIRVGSFKLAID